MSADAHAAGNAPPLHFIQENLRAGAGVHERRVRMVRAGPPPVHLPAVSPASTVTR